MFALQREVSRYEYGKSVRPAAGATVHDVVDSAATLADPGTRLGAAILDGIIFLAMIYIPLLIGLGLSATP